MPRPAYIAAHMPAGPAPMMMTSYFLDSGIRPPFQSRGITLPRQGPRQPIAEVHRFELDGRMLRAGQLLQRRGTDPNRAGPIALLAVQQRRRRLNQPLPSPR